MSYPNWLLWLGGTALPLALLWLLWRLALQRERCYAYNRALLLLAPAVAAALPLLPRPVLPAWLVGGGPAGPVAAVVLPALPVGATAPHAAAVVAGWPWLLALYLAGVAVGLTALGWQVMRLSYLARQLSCLEQEEYTLVRTGGQLPTSTFGRVVFWDETTALAPAEVAAVLAHELAHVRQHHTLDVLWLQLWRILLWPNPFAYLLLPALRLTHELLADEAAATATPAEPYAPLLARLAARQVAGGPVGFSLLRPFAFSSTLTRIAMLKNQFPVRRWKQWLVLPLLAALSLAGSRAATGQTTPKPDEAARKARFIANAREAFRQDSLRTGKGWRDEDPTRTIRVEKDGSIHITHAAPGAQPTVPELPGGGGAVAIVAAIQHNLVYPARAAPPASGNRVFVCFVVSTEGVAQRIRVIKSAGPAYDAAVVAAIQKLPRFTPARQDGQPVPYDFTVPVVFAAKP